MQWLCWTSPAGGHLIFSHIIFSFTAQFILFYLFLHFLHSWKMLLNIEWSWFDFKEMKNRKYYSELKCYFLYVHATKWKSSLCRWHGLFSCNPEKHWFWWKLHCFPPIFKLVLKSVILKADLKIVCFGLKLCTMPSLLFTFQPPLVGTSNMLQPFCNAHTSIHYLYPFSPSLLIQTRVNTYR